MQLMSVAAYAKKKGVHRSTVYRQIDAKKLNVVWKKVDVPMIAVDATSSRAKVKAD